MNTRKLIWRILLLVYLAVVIFLCFWNFQPDDSIPRTLWGLEVDKLVHAVMFIPFVPLCFMSTPTSWLRRKYESGSTVSARTLLALLIITLIGAAVAGLIELGQGLTTYRTRDMLDFRADLAGISFGLALTAIHCIFTKK